MWKTKAKMFVPMWEYNSGWIYFKADIYTELHFKNGTPRKLDLPNLEKALIDTVFEKLGVDDSLIKEKTTRKFQGEMGHIEVEVGLL